MNDHDHHHEAPPEGAEAPARHSSRGGAGARIAITRETRIGIAALFSFLILVTALVINKGRTAPGSGKVPPLAKIDNPKSSTTVVAHSEHSSRPVDQQRLRPASETPTPPLPVERAVAAVPAAESSALKVPNPVREPVQLARAYEPALLPSAPAAREIAQAEAPLPAPSPEPAGHAPAAGPSSELLPPATTEPPAMPSSPAPLPPNPTVSEPLAPITGTGEKLEPRPLGPESPTTPPVEPPPFSPVPSTPAGKSDSESRAKPKKEGQPSAVKRRQPIAEAPAPEGSDPMAATPVAPPAPVAAPALSVSAPPQSFEPIVATTPTANPFADPAAAAGQGGWVALPSASSRQGMTDEPKRPAKGAAPPIAHAPVTGPGAGGLVEPVPHVVRSGENFWTIARLHYGSGRYYMALWKANSDQVSAPEKLRVGQTIRIPFPEELDRSLILPPRTAAASPAATQEAAPLRRTSRSVADVELAVPVTDPFAENNRRRDDRKAGDIVAATPADADSDAPSRTRLPIYKIRPQETLRSIARDTLGDSRRSSEILELNRDVIDDPNHLTPGQVIDLPEDARQARTAR